jgi:ATP-dependent exoDNAse (exonuclease V) alpha subunit
MQLRTSIDLTPAQQEAAIAAIESAERETPHIITGGAGAGKSYVIRAIQEHYANEGYRIVSTAPTNSAALNIDGTTVCRWMGAIPYYDKRGNLRFKIPQQLDLFDDCDRSTGWALIVDEAFMLQKEWIQALDYKQGKANNRIIYVGDPEQLPPVGETDSILIEKSYPVSSIPGSQRFGNSEFLVDLANDLRVAGSRAEVFELLDRIPKKPELYALNKGYTCLSFTNSNCTRLNSIYTSYNDLPEIYPGQVLLMDRTILDEKVYTKEEITVTMATHDLVILDNRLTYNLHTPQTLLQMQDERSDLLSSGNGSSSSWSDFYKRWEQFLTLYYSRFRTVHSSQGQTLPKVALAVDDFEKCRDTQTLRRLAYTAVTRSTGDLIRI